MLVTATDYGVRVARRYCTRMLVRTIYQLKLVSDISEIRDVILHTHTNNFLPSIPIGGEKI